LCWTGNSHIGLTRNLPEPNAWDWRYNGRFRKASRSTRAAPDHWVPANTGKTAACAARGWELAHTDPQRSAKDPGAPAGWAHTRIGSLPTALEIPRNFRRGTSCPYGSALP